MFSPCCPYTLVELGYRVWGLLLVLFVWVPFGYVSQTR